MNNALYECGIHVSAVNERKESLKWALWALLHEVTVSMSLMCGS